MKYTVIVVMLAVWSTQCRAASDMQARDSVADVRYYTSVDVGRRLPLLLQDRGRGALYVFMDEKACLTCNITVRAMHEAVAAQDIRTVLIVPRMTKRVLDDYIMANDLPVVGVADELGVYWKRYGVDRGPVAMLLDGEGTVVFIAPIGTREFRAERFSDALASIPERRMRWSYCDPSSVPVHYTTRIPLDDSVASVSYRMVRVLGTEVQDRYVVQNFPRSTAAIVDTDGYVRHKAPVPPPSTSYVANGTTVVGSGASPTSVRIMEFNATAQHCQLYDYDLATLRVRQLPFPLEVTNRASRSVLHGRHGQGPVIGLTVCDRGTMVDTSAPTMAIYRDDRWIYAGRFPSFNFEYLFCPFSLQCFVENDSGFYAHHGFSTTIEDYAWDGTMRGRRTFTIPEHLAIAWEERMARITPASSTGNYADLADSSSRVSGLLLDEQNDVLYAVIVVPETHLRPDRVIAGLGRFLYFGVPLDVSRLGLGQGRVVEFPSQSRPFDIRDGQVRATYQDERGIGIAIGVLPDREQLFGTRP